MKAAGVPGPSSCDPTPRGQTGQHADYQPYSRTRLDSDDREQATESQADCRRGQPPGGNTGEDSPDVKSSEHGQILPDPKSGAVSPSTNSLAGSL